MKQSIQRGLTLLRLKTPAEFTGPIWSVPEAVIFGLPGFRSLAETDERVWGKSLQKKAPGSLHVNRPRNGDVPVALFCLIIFPLLWPTGKYFREIKTALHEMQTSPAGGKICFSPPEFMV